MPRQAKSSVHFHASLFISSIAVDRCARFPSAEMFWFVRGFNWCHATSWLKYTHAALPTLWCSSLSFSFAFLHVSFSHRAEGLVQSLGLDRYCCCNTVTRKKIQGKLFNCRRWRWMELHLFALCSVRFKMIHISKATMWSSSHNCITRQLKDHTTSGCISVEANLCVRVPLIPTYQSKQ